MDDLVERLTYAKLRELRERVAVRVDDYLRWRDGNLPGPIVGATAIAMHLDRKALSIRDIDMLDLIDAMIQEAGE